MNFSQFFLILRARKWIFLITLLVTVSVTMVVSKLLPKTYKASTSLLLNYKGVDPLTGLAMPSQLLPGYMATQVDIISSMNVARRVVDQLKMAESPAVIAQFNEATHGVGSIQDWLADLLLNKLEIVPSRESSVIEIGFKGSDPQFVTAVANAFADQYQRTTIQLKVDPLKKASAYFNEQTKVLRDSVEAAQSRLSKYQQEHGIVSVDNRLDVESNRLNDLSAQLVAAQGQSMEAASRRSMAQGSQSSESPDVATNPMIQSLKVSLGTAETRLAELAQRLGTNHPQYQSAKAEADKMRSELAVQMRITSNSVGNNAQILAQREGAIRAALAEQKSKVLELNRTRDEMNVLAKDVESAQRAFDIASQRFSQTKIEGQSDQSDIAVLNPAIVPSAPAGPRVWLNTALAAFLGSLLGLGIAMLAEMLDRRVRSDDDLSDVLGIPVLGAIEWNAPAHQRFRAINSVLPRNMRLN